MPLAELLDQVVQCGKPVFESLSLLPRPQNPEAIILKAACDDHQYHEQKSALCVMVSHSAGDSIPHR